MLGIAIIAAVCAVMLAIPPVALLPDRKTTLAGLGISMRRLALPGTARLIRREQVVELLDALEAELRSGAPAPIALLRASADQPDIVREARGEQRLGGDVAAGLLRDAARTRGRFSWDDGVLHRLAACWGVAQITGVGLADAVAGLAAAERQAARLADEIAAQAAEPRATIRVLAVLPLAGVAMSSGIGIDALGWLLHTRAGLACLALGVALDVAGVLWANSMIRAAANPR